MTTGLPISSSADAPLTQELRRRYGRQIRLQEIGEAGQARLCASTAAVHTSGFAGEIEARYLRAAGVTINGSSSRGTSVAVDCLEALGLRHPASRELAEGALSALSTIASILNPPEAGGK